MDAKAFGLRAEPRTSTSVSKLKVHVACTDWASLPVDASIAWLAEVRQVMARSAWGCLLVLGATWPAFAATPEQWLAEELPAVVDFYKQLHATPELSFQEHQTAQRVGDVWRESGFVVTHNVGRTGVVGVLENGDGPTLMIRTDLDALPLVERTGLPYASRVRTEDRRGTVVGVMHACGHDIHMANVVATARYLAANRDRWRGTLLLVGQPAEELGEGARAMLADGLFVRFPRPDVAIAMHVNNDLATGKVLVLAGFVGANVDSVDITIRGRGGHGSKPQQTIDPVVIAARLILDLQTIVSREVTPFEPAVVTVGSIHGGTTYNIIGDECHLQLTVRSFSRQVRKQLAEAIAQKANAAAAGSGAPRPEIAIRKGAPSLFNDPALTERVQASLSRALGEEAIGAARPRMGGEDFACFGNAGVPICLVRLGSIRPDRLAELRQSPGGPPPAHSPFYYPDPEETLRTGVIALSSVAMDLMPLR